MRGEIEFVPALRERVALLKGLSASVIDEVIRERIRLTPTPLHTDEHIDWLVTALGALWARCPLAQGKFVKIAAE